MPVPEPVLALGVKGLSGGKVLSGARCSHFAFQIGSNIPNTHALQLQNAVNFAFCLPQIVVSNERFKRAGRRDSHGIAQPISTVNLLGHLQIYGNCFDKCPRAAKNCQRVRQGHGAPSESNIN